MLIWLPLVMSCYVAPDKPVEVRQEAVEAQKPVETTQADKPVEDTQEDKNFGEEKGNQNQP